MSVRAGIEVNNSSPALRAGLPIAPVPPGAMVIIPFQPRRGCLHDFIKLIK